MTGGTNNSKSDVQVAIHTRAPADIGVSIARLREAFIYDPLSGHLVWNIRTGFHSRFYSQICGSKMRDGYLRIMLDKVFMLAHRAAWAHYHGEWPPLQIDHINRDKSDNRIANLRLATASQNTANQGLSSRNQHGVKGVTPLKNGKWQAAIGVHGRIRYLGCFDTKEQASACHAIAAKKAFGEFADAPGAPP